MKSESVAAVFDLIRNCVGIETAKVSPVPLFIQYQLNGVQRESMSVGNAPAPRLQEGDWVYFTRGKYKGDPARIREVRVGISERYLIALVPRLAPAEEGKRSRRALFDEEKIKDWYPGAEVIKKGNSCFCFNGQTFVNGLLHAQVRASSLSVEKPKPEDLGFFLRTEHMFGSIASNEYFLRLGDQVRVYRGELIGLEGEVTEMNEIEVRIQNNFKGNKLYTCTQASVLREEIRRILYVGDHVMVKAGPSKGRIGLILKLDDKQAIILPRYRWPHEAPFTPVSSS